MTYIKKMEYIKQTDLSGVEWSRIEKALRMCVEVGLCTREEYVRLLAKYRSEFDQLLNEKIMVEVDN